MLPSALGDLRTSASPVPSHSCTREYVKDQLSRLRHVYYIKKSAAKTTAEERKVRLEP